MQLNIKKLTATAHIPERGSSQAAGYDLYADNTEPVIIPPHETRMISLGIVIEIPEGWFGAIFARSGLAYREGIRPANCVGVVDPDYRGEWMIALHNDTDEDKSVLPGERVAQLVIIPYMEAVFNEVDELSVTERGTGGFGSTGKV